MSRDKSDGNNATGIPSSFEKRLMALEFDIKRTTENNSNKGLKWSRLSLSVVKMRCIFFLLIQQLTCWTIDP